MGFQAHGPLSASRGMREEGRAGRFCRPKATLLVSFVEWSREL